MPFLRALAILPLVAVALAGCSSDEPPAAVVTPPTGAAAPGNLTLAAPAWKVGQWWEHQWSLYSGGNVSFQFLMRNVVAEEKDGAWTVATENRTVAAFHGAFIFPTLGQFTQGNMTATVGEMRYPWYRFPLRADTAWTDTVTTLDFTGEKVSYPIDVKVTAIDERGAKLEARAGGKLAARYDYDVKSGWMSDAFYYDNEEQLAFRVQRLAAGTGHTGTVYDDTGAMAASTFTAVSPFFLAPAPAMQFPVPGGNTHLLTILFAFADNGGSQAGLVAPDGSHYEAVAAYANGIPLHDSSMMVLAPAVEGTWTFESGGAGVVAGGGMQAWAIKERAIQV